MRARATAAAALLCCAAAVSAPAAAVPATKLRRTRPENAINVTVVALRPYNISTLNDKDSADAAGDVFFYVGDTLPQKYACKRTTHAMGCGDNSILVHDQVYTVSMLEVDGTLGLVVDEDRIVSGASVGAIHRRGIRGSDSHPWIRDRLLRNFLAGLEARSIQGYVV